MACARDLLPTKKGEEPVRRAALWHRCGRGWRTVRSGCGSKEPGPPNRAAAQYGCTAPRYGYMGPRAQLAGASPSWRSCRNRRRTRSRPPNAFGYRPAAVVRYLCILLVGLSGTVMAIHPASRSGLITWFLNLVRSFFPPRGRYHIVKAHVPLVGEVADLDVGTRHKPLRVAMEQEDAGRRHVFSVREAQPVDETGVVLLERVWRESPLPARPLPKTRDRARVEVVRRHPRVRHPVPAPAGPPEQEVRSRPLARTGKGWQRWRPLHRLLRLRSQNRTMVRAIAKQRIAGGRRGCIDARAARSGAPLEQRCHPRYYVMDGNVE